jgi:hypothetical protein
MQGSKRAALRSSLHPPAGNVCNAHAVARSPSEALVDKRAPENSHECQEERESHLASDPRQPRVPRWFMFLMLRAPGRVISFAPGGPIHGGERRALSWRSSTRTGVLSPGEHLPTRRRHALDDRVRNGRLRYGNRRIDRAVAGEPLREVSVGAPHSGFELRNPYLLDLTA